MAHELIAAVDLGSNSFRLQVGRVVGNQIYPQDSLKEAVLANIRYQTPLASAVLDIR